MWSSQTNWEELQPPAFIEDEIQFVGQEAAKKQLEVFLDKEIFPNTLIIGEPGLGKTQLAKWVASRRHAPAQLHRNLPITDNDLDPSLNFVILDEVHMQKNAEWFFPLMESEEWAIIGTTNLPEKLSDAFLSRFIVRVRLRPYTVEDMKTMAELLDVEFQASPNDLDAIATASGGNPRQLQRLVSTAKALGTFDPEIVLSTVRINADGVTEDHLLYLQQLSKMSRPVGISYLASAAQVDQPTLKGLERLLLDLELVSLEPNGRVMTRKGRAYIALMKERGLV